MKPDDLLYLQHIVDALNKIESYIQGYNEDTFQQNSLVQDGVLRQIQIIGEAVKRLSPELRKINRMVPWKSIAGMRDKVVHDYLGVDLQLVWETITEDFPVLKTQVTEILNLRE